MTKSPVRQLSGGRRAVLGVIASRSSALVILAVTAGVILRIPGGNLASSFRWLGHLGRSLTGARAESQSYAAAPPALADSRLADELGVWRSGAASPVEFAEIAAASLDGVIYTGGGFTPPGGSVGRWFGRYDPRDDAWAERASMPQAVHHPGLAAAEGRIWLAGGYSGSLELSSATSQLHAYSPISDTWRRMTDMPGRRAAHGLVALAGHLYVVGGVGDGPDRMFVYDIASDRWSAVPGPTPREHLGSAASGGKVFAIAGRGYGRGNVGTLEAYDPHAGAWQSLPDMPGVCGGCSAAATGDGRIHITGGEGGGRTYREHFIYDPAARRWWQAASMPTARHGIGAAAVGGRFYVVGGGRTQGLAYSNLVEWWEPSDAPVPTPSPNPSRETPLTPPPSPSAGATSGPGPATPMARWWLWAPYGAAP